MKDWLSAVAIALAIPLAVALTAVTIDVHVSLGGFRAWRAAAEQASRAGTRR